jgi:hypothetical protein
MKELKVILSPNFSGEEFVEVVSGITFQKTSGVEVFSIKLEDQKLTGIQSALRKNILLAYDRNTRDFVNGQNFAKEEVIKEEKKEEQVISAQPLQEEKEAAKEVEVKVEEKEPAKKEAPKKETAKKAKKRTKKDTE